MKLLETKEILENMIYPQPRSGLTTNEAKAIKRALVEVEITIDNGDELNLYLVCDECKKKNK